jgi:FKBP-type peptidyl-prolyl cis-trans isomerase
MMRFLAVLMLTMLLAAACGGDDDADAQQTQTREGGGTEVVAMAAPTATPAPLPARVDLGEGLQYDTLAVGSGAAMEEGETARLELRLASGEKELFAGEFGFRIGSGQAVPGLDRAVKGMRVGEERRITIPFALAKDAQGKPLAGLQDGDELTATATLVAIEKIEEQ